MGSSKKPTKPAAAKQGPSKQGPSKQGAPGQGGAPKPRQPTGAPRPSAPKPPPAPPANTLVALVDGVALPEAEGAALWHAFSEHMDQHQGDLAGFARSRGYASVKPEFRGGQAVLVVVTR